LAHEFSQEINRVTQPSHAALAYHGAVFDLG
jgi:hypothetical protein